MDKAIKVKVTMGKRVKEMKVKAATKPAAMVNNVKARIKSSPQQTIPS
ncbi:hypothetical protein ACFPYJ_12320 [Paenibacillus solisilvae]|uniref:Uncharacterized protein n=1 Tax=Paenibacillus solisilvae TaxID=2486751 RepID=A0ABW0W0G2_9BACL